MAKYYIKHRKLDKGPYAKEELAELLGALKIGSKIKIKRADRDGRYIPLNSALPNLCRMSVVTSQQPRKGCLLPQAD